MKTEYNTGGRRCRGGPPLSAHSRIRVTCRQVTSAACIVLASIEALFGAGPAAQQPPVPEATPATGAAISVYQPPGYVIGAEDVLAVEFWGEKDLSGEVIVRPDGKISLPLLNDMLAAGLTPDQLRTAVQEESRRYLEDPSVTVIVKQINSRRVFITGEVEKPGVYPLKGPTTVVQLIAMAGGLREFADSDHICIMRSEAGRPERCSPFNYRNFVKEKNLSQNIELRPGDTVIVP